MSNDLASTESTSATMAIEWILGASCATLIANLYYAQPLTGLIGRSLDISTSHLGIIVTMPLAGYGLGLLLAVPLGDLIENRMLVLIMTAVEAVCLAALSLATNASIYLALAFVMGIAAASVQILVPYVTYLVSEARRGQAVGRVVSGVMLGIMLARPLASLTANAWGWRFIFRFSACLTILLAVMLWRFLPIRKPVAKLTYRQLLQSMASIYATTSVLRRRGLYHAAMFGAFSVFWTTVPLWLTSPRFGLSQQGVAWVALAGVAGAIAPPIAGRLADRGYSRGATSAMMWLAALSLIATRLAFGQASTALAVVTLAAVTLDFAVASNLVLSQRAIYALGSEQRSRLNGLFMATFFVGGAVSSALGAWCYSRFGWTGAVLLGSALPLCEWAYFLTERVPKTP